MTAKTPTDAYTEQVSAIIGDAPAGSYRPEKPVELFIANRRVPTSCAGLSAPEKVELERMWRGQDLDTLLATGMSPVGEDDDPDEAYPLDLEIADVVTDTGELRYRIYGMNYGGMFLMRADRLECVAFASQHSVEYWRVDQRDLFWAMDRALRRGGHGFVQPVHFEWGNDARWADIATKTPGTVASEPYVRNQFADPAA